MIDIEVEAFKAIYDIISENKMCTRGLYCAVVMYCYKIIFCVFVHFAYFCSCLKHENHLWKFHDWLVGCRLVLWLCICVFIYLCIWVFLCNFPRVHGKPSLEVQWLAGRTLVRAVPMYLWICAFIYLCICVFGYFCVVSHVSKTWKTIFGSSMTGWWEVGGCCAYVSVNLLIC